MYYYKDMDDMFISFKEDVEMAKKKKPWKPKAEEPLQVNIITMADIHDNPLEIQDRLLEGYDFVLTWHGRPIAYIQHLTSEDRKGLSENPPADVPFIGMYEARLKKRRQFIQGLRSGDSYILRYHRTVLGFVTADIPEGIIAEAEIASFEEKETIEAIKRQAEME